MSKRSRNVLTLDAIEMSRRHAGQTHFLDPAVLGGAEKPLHASFRLRAVSGDPLDAQFFQGSAKLRLPAVVRPPMALGLENTVAIGVQRQRPTVLAQPAAQKVEMTFQRLARIEASLDATGGVVDHGN